MSMEAASTAPTFSEFEQLRLARDVLRAEAEALVALIDRLDTQFCRAVDLIVHCQGSVIVTGMGKAGLIGQKIAATLASTGTPSHFVHPAEAMHGDLGRVAPADTILVLSFSGETEEVTRLLPFLRQRNHALIAITADDRSALGAAADATIQLGRVREACSLGLAPSTSTTLMLAVGDALALVASCQRGFRAEDFARFHPGGSLGTKLARVDDVMRPLNECRVASDQLSVREVFARVSRPGRRTGAVMLVDAQGQLTGLFTDSDLARILESKRDSDLDAPIHTMMTKLPTRVVAGTMLVDAVELLAERKISELPVVDERSEPVGLIDITDVVGLLPNGAGWMDAGGTRRADRLPNRPVVPFSNPSLDPPRNAT